jgi:hypothetical protein
LALNCRHNVPVDRFQQSGITPRGLGNEVMQRLMFCLNVRGIEARRHRFDALAFTVQQQAGTVIPQRKFAIRMPHGLRQPVHICREALLLRCWRQDFHSHENIIEQIRFL